VSPERYQPRPGAGSRRKPAQKNAKITKNAHKKCTQFLFMFIEHTEVNKKNSHKSEP
jgi:hypothetical protein